MIREITKFEFFDVSVKEYHCPTTVWLSTSNILSDISIKISGDGKEMEFSPFGKTSITVCNVDDLNSFLKIITVYDISLFRLEILETKKWGAKPLFKNGIKSLCFQASISTVGDQKVLVLYNTDGTKAIESIYVHGIWLIDSIK